MCVWQEVSKPLDAAQLQSETLVLSQVNTMAVGLTNGVTKLAVYMKEPEPEVLQPLVSYIGVDLSAVFCLLRWGPMGGLFAVVLFLCHVCVFACCPMMLYVVGTFRSLLPSAVTAHKKKLVSVSSSILQAMNNMTDACIRAMGDRSLEIAAPVFGLVFQSFAGLAQVNKRGYGAGSNVSGGV